MVLMSKTYGFKTLGPFYITTQIFGLSMVREIDNKICCSKKSDGTGHVTDGSTNVFSTDKRFLAYNALLAVLLYLALRRCATLIGPSPWCMDMFECPSSVEWFTVAAGAVQAMVSIAVATVHRPSGTVRLLNSVHDVLTRGGGGGGGRDDLHVAGGDGPRTVWPHWGAAGTYAAVVTAAVLGKSVAVHWAFPDRFAVADMLLVCLPVAAVPVVVECAIVTVCRAAENACRNTVDRLARLVAACDARGRGASWAAKRQPVHWQLEAVWRDYWHGCRLVDHLSQCYGLDLAVNLTSNMLLFIGHAYVCIMMLLAYSSRSAPGDVTDTAGLHWIVALVCQLTCVSFRIVFISYRAERIKQVGKHSVLKSLRNLIKTKNLDISTVLLINSFTYQIINRELKVSACGFFSVDLSFFHAVNDICIVRKRVVEILDVPKRVAPPEIVFLVFDYNTSLRKMSLSILGYIHFLTDILKLFYPVIPTYVIAILVKRTSQ